MPNNLVIVSDLHCGDQVGLCPLKGAVLDSGGIYKPNKVQIVMAKLFDTFWSTWVPHVTHGEEYDIVVNGDVIDGHQAKSTHQITNNLATQRKIAYEVLAPIVDRCKGQLYMIRGTPYHSGESGEEEETLAKMLGATPNSDNQYARYELWKKVGDKLVHIMHHIGTTSSSAYEATAVHKELTEELTESARWGETPPNIVVRSHRHRYLEVKIAAEASYAISLVTPGWQAKTPFAYKIPGARLSPPQFGGILIRQGDEEIFTRSKVWNLKRARVE